MLQTNHAKGNKVAPTPAYAGQMCSYRAEIDLLAADLTLNKIIEMGPLPAGCDLVDAILDGDDLDTGSPAIVADVGIMSGDAGVDDDDRTCDDELFDGTTLFQAGGVARPTLVTAFRIARSDVDRGIGVKITVIPATAAAGKIGLTLFYRG